MKIHIFTSILCANTSSLILIETHEFSKCIDDIVIQGSLSLILYLGSSFLLSNEKKDHC